MISIYRTIFLVVFFSFFTSAFLLSNVNTLEKEKGQDRILELLYRQQAAKEKRLSHTVSSTSETQSADERVFIDVLIETTDKEATKRVLDSAGMEKYEAFKHLDFVYAHIDESTLSSLASDSSTIYFYENRALDTPQPIASSSTPPLSTAATNAYTGKGTVVAIIDTGITDHEFITDTTVTTLDGSTAGRIAYQECRSTNTTEVDHDGSNIIIRSLCEGGVTSVTGGTSAMNCDTTLTDDCYHGLAVASTISGARAEGTIASTPDPSAPDAQLAIFKASVGLCNNGADDNGSTCTGTEEVLLWTTPILYSIDSIIDRKMEYLNGDADGDAGLNIVAVNMSFGFSELSSTECAAGAVGSTGYLFSERIYSDDSTKATLHKYGIVPITSSGNAYERDGEGRPACYEKAISIAALSNTLTEVAYFSNVSSYTDFIDKGHSIKVASIGSTTEYGTISGTSFSSPRVAGHYATLAEKYPDATIDERIERLKAFAVYFADTRSSAVHTEAIFPYIDIDASLAGTPVDVLIEKSVATHRDVSYDSATDTYSTLEDSLDITFISHTSDAHITSSHFIGERDATSSSSATNGVTTFSATIPLIAGHAGTVTIHTVDDLTSADDIISTDSSFTVEQIMVITIEGNISDGVFSQDENITSDFLATVTFAAGYTGEYALTDITTSCDDASVQYKTDNLTVGSVQLSDTESYRFCVRAINGTTTVYASADFVVFYELELKGPISDGLLSLQEYNQDLPLIDTPTFTIFTHTYALTDTATSCDDTSISYLSDVPTTADSSFTDSSSHRFCVASVSSNGDYFYTTSGFDVDLSLNVLSGVLWDADTLVIYLDTFLETVTDTTGGAGFVIKDLSAAEHIPTSYSTRNNKIFLNFSSALPTTGTFEFTKADPSIFLAGTIPLESFSAQDIAQYNLDIDESGAYDSSRDAVFLLFSTQSTTVVSSRTFTNLLRNGTLEYDDAKANVDILESDGVLDFDESGAYDPRRDAVFLLFSTQPTTTVGQRTFTNLLRDGTLEYEDAKANVDILLD